MKKPILFFCIGWLCFAVGYIGLYYYDAPIYTKASLTAVTPDGITHTMALYRPNSDSTSLKPAILLCHGMGVNKEFFHNYAVEFTKLGYVCISVELRGHGQSSGVLPGIGLNVTEMQLTWPNVTAIQYEMENAMAVLKNQSDVDITRISAIGHSMGGGSVLEASVLHPDWFRSTVTLAALPVWEINTTNPKNLLVLHGGLDEAFTEKTERALFAQALGSSDFEYATTYGNISMGTARRMVLLPWDDHASEFIDPLLTQEAINWIEISNGVSSENLTIKSMFDLQLPARLIWMAIGIFGILSVWISSALVFYPKKTPLISSTESNADSSSNSDLSVSNTVKFSLKSIVLNKKFLFMIIISSIFGCGLFFAAYATGAVITAAFCAPLAGLGIGLLISYRKSLFSVTKPINLQEIMFSILVGGSVYLLLISFGNNFFNMFPNPPIYWIPLFLGLVTFGIIPLELFIRQNLQDPWEKQLEANGQQTQFKSRFLLYLKVTIVQTIILALATVIPFGIEYLMIKNYFPWMFMGMLIMFIFLFGFIGSIWYRFTKRAWINTFVAIIPITFIMLAATSRISTFAFFT